MWKLLNQITRTGLCSEKPSAAPWACNTLPQEHSPEAAQHALLKIVGRALTIRAIDAGSCNGCELEMHALSNPYYNLEGAGLRFVASPRHADLLLVTGPVARNMLQPLLRTIEATPRPRFVVALGECACTGGWFGDSYATLGALSRVLPVDLHIPGCPPEPGFILACLLNFLQRLPAERLPA